MKKALLFILVLAGFLVLLSGCKKEAVKEEQKTAKETMPQEGPKVLAVVNGEEITDVDLEADLAAMHGPHPGPPMDMVRDPRQKREMLDRLIEKKLMAQAAEKEGVADSPAIEARIKAYRNQLIMDELRKKIFSREVEVTEEEMKESYEKNPDMFGRPRMIHARQIVLKDRETADKVLSELKSDPSKFEALAKEYSEDMGTKERGGDMGPVHRHMYPPEIDDALFRLEENQISDVIDMHGRFYILQVTEKEKPEEGAFERYKEQVRRRVEGQKKQEMWKEYVEGLKSGAKIEYMETPEPGGPDMPR